MQAVDSARRSHAAGFSELASIATARIAGDVLPALRDRSRLLTLLSILGVASGLLIAALLSRDPREAGAYAVACVMMGGAIALGARANDDERAPLAASLAQQQVRAAAHDLKAPLLTVTSYLELIADGAFGDLSDDARAAVLRAAEVSTRAQTVIDSALQVSPASVGPHLVRVPLDRVLSEVMAALNAAMRERGATVAVEGRLGVVMAEEPALFRIVENLVQNAIKFCPEDRVPRVAISTRRIDGRFVELSIVDNGAGMPADPDFLLYRGTRGTNARQVPGQGIGLATVARLVAAMGGTMRFDTPSEGGTAVRVLLRADDARPDTTA